MRMLWGVVLAASLLGQDSGDFKISADVTNVVLPVSVLDHKGEYVPGLEEKDFRVFQDGRPQKISFFSQRDAPLSIGLVLDASGSMGPKRGDAITAALHFVHLSNPEDQLFVVTFNEKVMASPFTNNPNQLREELVAAQCTGQTALYDALDTALHQLSKGSRDKKALILVSDGGDNASRKATYDQVLSLARDSNALIYTIGVFDPGDPDRNEGVLKKLAKSTGGETYLPQQSKELPKIAAHIATDLRNQYTLAYVPEASETGYHRLQVFAQAPGHSRLVVRTRPGYYIGAKAE